MANKTSLIITSTDTSGKTFNKTLTDVNAHASAANLKAFAQGLNGLTKNTYDSAALVERTEIVDNTDLPLAHVEFTINGRTYTEADADMNAEYWPTLTLTFNASDTTYIRTNSDGRKEVRFPINYVETSALGESLWGTGRWANNCPRVSLGINPDGDLYLDNTWGIYHGLPDLFVRVEFFDEGSDKDRDAIIAIGGTKARRGWRIIIKLNREA